MKEFKVGDKVSFINEFGVVFTGATVIGFRVPEINTRNGQIISPERTVFINSSCYWFAKNPKRLILEDKKRTLVEINEILKEINPTAHPAICFGNDGQPPEISDSWLNKYTYPTPQI